MISFRKGNDFLPYDKPARARMGKISYKNGHYEFYLLVNIFMLKFAAELCNDHSIIY